MVTNIENIDANISEQELKERDLSTENIVATFDLNQEFDLSNLYKYLDSTEYEPETSPFLVYRPQSEQGTILIPTNGKASLVGCKTKNQIQQLAIHLVEALSSIAPADLPSPSSVEIQNIVVQGDIDHELNLPPIITLLGMERTEYEPEQFPGVVYRPGDGTTILLFSSGKFMINGATSYSQAISSVERLLATFRNGNVPMGNV